MELWMILALTLLLLWLLSLIRIGASAEYDSTGLLVRIKAGPVNITVFPVKKKDKPSKAARREKRPEAAKPPAKGGNLALVKEFLPLIAEAAGRLKKKIRMDNIELNLVWGSSDPAAAAMGFGWANAALGMLWPLMEHNFNVRKRKLRTAVDYNATTPVITIRAALSLTVGQMLVLGAVLGVKVLKLLQIHRKKQKLKEAV